MFTSLLRHLPLLLTVFVDSLGFGVVFPIFSPLLINNEAGIFSPEVSLAMRGLVFGVLVSSFCIGQFFGSPVLGSLSDRAGRKNVLIYSMWGAALGYAFGALGIAMSNLFTLFLSRIVSGFAAGGYAVAQSVIADMSTKENKSKNFGLLGMAWGSGFVIGPYMGGKLALVGYMVPFLVSALFCVANGIFLSLRFKESIARRIPTKISWFSGIYQIRKAFGSPELRGVFVVMFVFSLGWGFFTEFAPVFLMRYFGFNVARIANFYAWVGLWVALCQGILIRPLLKGFSPKTLLPIALVSLGVILPTVFLIKGIIGLFWLLPCIAFAQALIYPTSVTIVSNSSSAETQGEILGIYSSVQWAAISLAPLFSGSLVALYPHLPVTFASGCMLIAFLLFLPQFRQRKQSVEE